MNITVVDRIVRPKLTPGVDWGGKRIVLVRLVQGGKCVKELWWYQGSSYWADRCTGTAYSPARLLLVSPASYSHTGDVERDIHEKELQEGGRLSRDVVVRYAEQIDEFFGEKVSHLINIRKTVVME